MMDTFWFWVMKSVAELAVGISIFIGLIVLFFLYVVISTYILVPYANYKERKRWISKDYYWVSDSYHYHCHRRYQAYSDWRPWMQEVYELKKKEFEDGKR